ncbi:MAG: DUF3107 domain-containing protein [Acidimicrobiales bacterium]
MIVRIGVAESTKELDIDMADDTDVGELKQAIEDAVTEGSGVLWLTDRHGRQVGVPALRVAYVDLGESGGGPKIGFGA